jgi:predicted aspartyl protease
MGRITTPVVLRNTLDPRHELRVEALVDTGAGWLTLPMAWRERLGPLPVVRTEQLETADQRVIPGVVCGPVTIQIDGFRPIVTEVIFMDMEPRDERYDALLGYLVLEQSSAVVDMVAHCLVPVRYVDAKVCRYGTSSTLPVVFRPSSARCASAARASG